MILILKILIVPNLQWSRPEKTTTIIITIMTMKRKKLKKRLKKKSLKKVTTIHFGKTKTNFLCNAKHKYNVSTS